jgi:hypothetical protein
LSAIDQLIDIPEFLARRNAVKCLRCKVTVEIEKLDMPNRCADPRCPLSKLVELYTRKESDHE